MSSVTRSQGESIFSTIRITPAAVRPSPQWFSRPSTTPHSSARGRSRSIDSITQPKPSSSVWPGRFGSIPLLAISSSKFFDVPQRPVLMRMVGMPRR